jgi:dUTP pyrophosphatase
MNRVGFGSPTVFVKLLNEDAQVPTKSKRGDAGWDLYSTEDITISGGDRKTIHTGIALQIPDEWVGLIWPRSGLSVKKGVDVLAGVIDSNYRGEVMVCLLNTQRPLPLFETPHDTTRAIQTLSRAAQTATVAVKINKGDRIAQILFQPIPTIPVERVDILDDTERGSGGFGSTGK